MTENREEVYICTVVKDNRIMNIYSSKSEEEIYIHIEEVARQYIEEGAEYILAVKQYDNGKVERIYEWSR